MMCSQQNWRNHSLKSQDTRPLSQIRGGSTIPSNNGTLFYHLRLVRQNDALSLFCFWACGQTSIPSISDENLVKERFVRQNDALSFFCFWAFGQTSIPSISDANLVKEVQAELKGEAKFLRELLNKKRLIMLRKKHSLQRKWELLSHKAFHAQVSSVHTGPINETQCFEMNGAAISYGSASELYLSLQDVMRDMALYMGCQHSLVHKKRLIMLRKNHSLQGKWELLNHKEFHTQVVSVHTDPINETQWFEMNRAAISYGSASELYFSQQDVMRDMALCMGFQHSLVHKKRLIILRKKHSLQGKWELLNHKGFHAQVVSVHTDPINETEWFEMNRAAISYGSASELYFSQQDVMQDLALYMGCQHSLIHKKRLIMLRKKHSLQGKWELLNHKAFHAQVVTGHTGPINETQCFEMVKAAISYGSASELYFSQQDVMRDLALYMGCQHSLVHKKRLILLRKKHSLQGKWELLNHKAFHAQVVSVHRGLINEIQCFEMIFSETEALVLFFTANEYFVISSVKSMEKN